MARTETVTVVFTDLVGSTELASRLGHDAYEALRQEHFSTLRAAVAKHDGIEVKTTGDGLMLRFDSAASAVACTVAMQQATDGAVPIRIGVSSGEASRENDDWFGPPVVEAARLCAAAAGGQIVVSDLVRGLARGRGHAFASLGELTLKGLPEAVPSYEVEWEPLEPLEPEKLPLPPRLTKAPLAMFGRTTESEALAAAWAKAREGQRQLVLIAGEPGIGKTRLATETALAAHAEGAVVLLGTCDEDVNLPYQPFVEALRHYVAHAPEDVLTAYVREHKGELARLVPELARRIADLPSPQVAEAETERYLLFEAATGLLSEASKQQPIVLILDDLHWAGAPELLLLKHVLKTAMPLRLLVIGTYRDTDLTRTHPLTSALADFRRETGVERIALHGLDEAAVVGLVTAAAGHELTEPGMALARALHHETEGSPFFIGEILRHLSESGAIFQEGDRWTFKGDIGGLGIPEGIKEVIGRRLSRLSEDANKVLHLAAVIGRQFDVALLTRIADMSEDAILDALDEAIGAALVAEVPGTSVRFAFSHALIRTTLYEELNAARRARLHHRVGEALEELTGANPEARIDELAHHWLAATQVSDQAKAIGYARQAGDHALANLAFEEAAAHYERALAVLEPRDEDGRRLRCDLLLALGNVQRRAGNASYREAVAKALDEARVLGDGERLARAVLGHARAMDGYVASSNVVDEGLLALYEEASAALGEVDSLLRVRVLGQLAANLVYTSERERRHALSREAVEIARRLGDPLGLAQALNLRLHAIEDPFKLAERLDLSAELTALVARVGSSELAWHAANHRASALFESGDIVGAEQSFAELERLGGELRQPFHMHHARMGRAMVAILRGAPDAEAEAFAAFELGMAAGEPDAANAFGGQIYLLRDYQGRLGELLDIVRANAEAQPHIPGWRAAVAHAYCDTDQLAEAVAQVDALRGGGFDYPPNLTWESIVVALSEVVSDLRDRSAAAVLYERMRPIAKQAAALGHVISQGSYGLFCGMLAACLGRWDDAEGHFTDAIEMNERFGARPSIVRTRRAWASMLLDRNASGDAARAAELIAAGRAEAEQLGMAREIVRFERLIERLG